MEAWWGAAEMRSTQRPLLDDVLFPLVSRRNDLQDHLRVLLTELGFTIEFGEFLIWLVSSSRPTVNDNRTVYFPGVSKRNLLVNV